MYSNKKHNFENELLKAELAKADQLAKAVSATELDPFDKASVQLINKYKDAVEVDAFRAQMKRICELAGINYELEKSRWWRKHHQQQAQRD
jgi:hypothetical protein